MHDALKYLVAPAVVIIFALFFWVVALSKRVGHLEGRLAERNEREAEEKTAQIRGAR